MLNAQTQTQLTGNRIETVLKEDRKMKAAKRTRTWKHKTSALRKPIVRGNGDGPGKREGKGEGPREDDNDNDNGDENEDHIHDHNEGNNVSPKLKNNRDLRDVICNNNTRSSARRMKRGQANRTMGHSPVGRQKEV